MHDGEGNVWSRQDVECSSSSNYADARILVSTQRLEAAASITFCIHMYNAVPATWVIANAYFYVLHVFRCCQNMRWYKVVAFLTR